MTTLYTAGAANDGFYITAVVAAANEADANAALSAFFADATDEGGEYEMDEVTARIADEDGCYPNDSTGSYDLDGREWAVEEAFASPGTVVMLDSGANG